MDNYFNLSSPGTDPFGGISPSSSGALQLVVTNCFLAYVAPFDGEVVTVNVNSAFSTSYFGGAEFDFIIIRPGPAYFAGGTQWTSGTYATGKQMSGWSNSFTGSTIFRAGDLIFCYIVDTNGNYWGLGTPIPPDNGIFNVTLYLRF